jgi:hypothetical protein
VLAARLPTWKASTNSTLAIGQLNAAIIQLHEGERHLQAKLNTANVEDYEICKSRGIALLMLDRISQDIMRGSPDVVQIYSDYCQQLVRHPSDTHRQPSLTLHRTPKSSTIL